MQLIIDFLAKKSDCLLEIVDGKLKINKCLSLIIKKFNHLKIHTQYSICEGAVKIDDLKENAKELKIRSLGICDTSNLCGAVEFSDKLSKVGTQPIIGTQINFKFNETTGLLPLFALDFEGYKKIIELSSRSYLENDNLSDPHLDINNLFELDTNGISIFFWNYYWIIW